MLSRLLGAVASKGSGQWLVEAVGSGEGWKKGRQENERTGKREGGVESWMGGGGGNCPNWDSCD